MSNMISSGKLTLTSKIFGDQYMKMTSRKPVKDCYCYSEVKKMCQRLSRLPQKSCHCINQSELTFVRETDEMIALASPISCETFRRVQRIDYTPRSQFLRRVQNKICELQSRSRGDCLRMCPRSSSYHRFAANGRMQNTGEKALSPNERKYVDARQTPSISPSAPANSLVSVRGESDRDNTVCVSNVRTPQKLVKSTLRKTIKSGRQVSGSSKSSSSKSPIRKNKQDCSCLKIVRNQGDLEQITKRDKDQLGTFDVSEHYEEKQRRNDKTVDRDMRNLRRFREQHYFETHGSSHTLASSRSSGSLEQYFLNDRLFPEPVGKIHRRDLVVTMPPCATTQRKRIHYFPRHVVQQEKDICNTNYKRKRHQNCPLTGHAIDIGVLKIKLPLDSLALKYQKKIDTTVRDERSE